MTAVNNQSTKIVRSLHVAFELSWGQWKLAFGTQAADNPRLRTVNGRDRLAVLREITAAKTKFRLPADAPVVCCYEAGRDGHWLHRFLSAQPGFTCHEVDSSSIEVNRRQRRAKSDKLDAGKLLSMLIRYEGGERQVWRVVHVPSVEAETQRHLHRELEDWQDQRRQHSNRIKGLLASEGHDVEVDGEFPRQLALLRNWSDSPVAEALQARLLRQYEGWQFADGKVKELEKQRSRAIHAEEAGQGRVRELLALKGIGAASAWLFVREVFGWRKIKNRRQMGSLAGLTPTPYASGKSSREQGISKAGNRRLRVMALEIAWCWVQFQPKSELTLWFLTRFGLGKRSRKIGIVAVARKLLVALWKYVEHGEVPKGAELVDWKKKVRLPREVGVAAKRGRSAG